MPMLVCGSKTDSVVNPPALDDWRNWFKPEDRLWEFPQGYHFFHYFHPQEVGAQIMNFSRFHNRGAIAASAQPSTTSIYQ